MKLSVVVLMIAGALLLSYIVVAPPTIVNSSPSDWRPIGLAGKAVYGIAPREDAILGGVNAAKNEGGGIWQTNPEERLFPADHIRSLEKDEASGAFFASSFGDGVLFSPDGIKWQLSNEGLTSLLLYDVLPAPDDMLYAASATQGLFIKAPMSSSWTQGGKDCPQTLIDLALKGEDLLIASWGEGAFISRDQGESCQGISDGGLPGENIRIRAIHATPSGAILASVYGTGVYRWEGDAWHEVSGIGKQTVYTFLDWPDSGSVLAGTDQGVYVSEDDGKCWRKLGSLNHRVFSLYVQSNMVYAGTNDGIWAWPPLPTPTPGIALTMHADPSREVGENGWITYTIEITGTGVLTDVHVIGSLDDHVELIDASPGGRLVDDNENRSIRWDLYEVSPPNFSTTLTYTIDIVTQSLQGVVFEDTENPGAYDDFERGIPGITIIIRQEEDQQLLWAESGEEGIFQFPILKPGTYNLRVFNPPADHELTTGNDPGQIEIIDGEMALVHIGYRPLTPTPENRPTLTPTPTSTPTPIPGITPTPYAITAQANAYWTHHYTSNPVSVWIDHPFEIYLPVHIKH